MDSVLSRGAAVASLAFSMVLPGTVVVESWCMVSLLLEVMKSVQNWCHFEAPGDLGNA